MLMFSTALPIPSDFSLVWDFRTSKNQVFNALILLDQWPIAWKVITLRAGVHCKASVTYCARIAFSTAQVDRDNIVDAQSWIEVQVGFAELLGARLWLFNCFPPLRVARPLQWTTWTGGNHSPNLQTHLTAVFCLWEIAQEIVLPLEWAS